MPDEIVVKGASVSLTPAVPTVIITTSTHTLSVASSGPFVAADGNEALLESDIDASFVGFQTLYDNSPFLKGTLIYQSLKSVSDLSKISKKNGEAVALKSTTGTITCSVIPAIDPTPPPPTGKPDTAVSYDLDFSFTDAGQTLLKSD